MEFNDEQLAAINQMIADKVQESTENLTGQITSLKTQNESLIGEKRTAKAQADEAERNRLAASGTVDEYKTLVTNLETQLNERDADLKKINFDHAITAAVAARNIRPEARDDMIDALKFRATYQDGVTTIGDKPVTAYLDEILSTDRGKFYLPPSGTSGGGATGSSNAPVARMTKENFNMTQFMNFPKSERDVIADQMGKPELKNLP